MMDMEKKPRNIVIEGTECTGKTTLIDELSRKIREWDIKYLPHRSGNQFKRYAWEYLMNEHTIFNRSHLSEVVCGNLWRNGPGMSEAELTALNQLLEQDCLVVFADADLAVIAERFSKRNYKEKAEYQELAEMQEGFRQIMKTVPHMYYESKDEVALKQIVERIAAIIEGRT